MELKNKEFKAHESGLFVASDGEVFVPSNSRYKEHFTFGSADSNGYLQVRRNYKLYYVHRLVAECWIPNLDNLPTVDHINRDRTDNRVENLRWADRSMQIQNRGKFNKPNYPKNRKGSKKVLQLTLDEQLVREWPSINECGRNGFRIGDISKCCNEKSKSHKGYIWRYK